MDFTNTKVSFRRPLTDYTKVQQLLGALVRNRRWLQRIPLADYLNIGCGPNARIGYINMDYRWRPGQVCWDATRRLPLGDHSLKGVYTEHCLEHLPFQSIAPILAEIKRVLRPGGTVRIVVPDAELYVRRYISGEPMPYAEFDKEHGVYSPMMSINRIFRAHGHLYSYDFSTLSKLMENAGFLRISKEGFMSGRDSHLLIDSESRRIESLYVEAAS